jgi:hypothetical protein
MIRLKHISRRIVSTKEKARDLSSRARSNQGGVMRMLGVLLLGCRHQYVMVMVMVIVIVIVRIRIES